MVWVDLKSILINVSFYFFFLAENKKTSNIEYSFFILMFLLYLHKIQTDYNPKQCTCFSISICGLSECF